MVLSNSSRSLSLLVQAVRERPDDESTRNDLAEAVSKTLSQAAMDGGLPPEDAKDLAHDLVLEMCEYLIFEDIRGNAEAACVRRLAKWRALDHHRKNDREQRRLRRQETESQAESAGDVTPEHLLDAAESQAAAEKSIASVLKEPGVGIPENYRRVLVEIYIHHRSLGELAEENLDRCPHNQQTGAPRTLKQARLAVDQHHTRAKRWLHDYVDSMAKEEID